MASWLLLPFSSFPWPPPPPPGSSSGRGGDGGGDGGDWRPTVVAAFAGVQVGRALRRRFAGLLRSPEVRHLDALPKMGSFWFEGSESLATFHILGAIGIVFSAPYVCSSALFSGNGSGGRYISNGKLLSRRPRGIDSKKRLWTNVLLALNVL
nr:unknown [Zea mays]